MTIKLKSLIVEKVEKDDVHAQNVISGYKQGIENELTKMLRQVKSAQFKVEAAPVINKFLGKVSKLQGEWEKIRRTYF